MENQTQEKKFISKSFDKFKNRTDTNWIDPLASKVFGGKWGTWIWEMDSGYGEDRYSSQLSLKLRHVKTPDLDSILIDYTYYSKEWMFLRDGNLIINIDGVDNVELDPHESDTKVGEFGGSRITEKGFYNITKEQLKQICDAKEISVRISGNSYFELEDKGLLKFHFMCRSFYADLYEDTSHDEWINTIIPPGSEKKGSCFIATAAMGDYNHPVVMDLRLFRDNWLLKREWGVKFTNWYYTHGPKAARVIDKSTMLKKITYCLVVKPLQVITKRLK